MAAALLTMENKQRFLFKSPVHIQEKHTLQLDFSIVHFVQTSKLFYIF